MIPHELKPDSEHPRQSRITLFFDNKNLEASFRIAHSNKTLTQIRLALLLATALYVMFSILDVKYSPEVSKQTLMIRFGIAMPAFLFCLALTFHRYFKKHIQLLVMGVINIAGLGIMAIAVLHQNHDSEFALAGTFIPVFWAFLFSGLYFVNAAIAVSVLIIVYNSILIYTNVFPIATFVSFNFFIFTCAIIGIFGGYTIERYYRSDFIKNRIIKESHIENERLLLNILPRSIADELKRNPGTIAKQFDRITILFADLVNFTEFASGMDAKQVVTLLNDIFSIFDKLTDNYRLEKIKTIGDAYMVTGGLQHTGPETVAEVASYALAIRNALHEFNLQHNLNLNIRIGIHTGPAVAGVIGVKRFIYDVWGDSVNIASRMESTCEPGEIQLSEDTYKILKDQFRFTDKGKINIKGKGEIHVYYLIDNNPG